MLNTILAATDGSEHADKAIELATDMAAKYGAKLVILHVTTQAPVPEVLRHAAEIEHVTAGQSPDYSIPLASAPRAGEQRDSRSQVDQEVRGYIARNLLNQASRRARKKGIEDVRQLTEEGDPAKQILATADREKADMIVLGSRGLGDLKGLLVGSVSHKVSHLSSCTCVCVK